MLGNVAERKPCTLDGSDSSIPSIRKSDVVAKLGSSNTKSSRGICQVSSRLLETAEMRNQDETESAD